jgi:Tfp pilus assembly protein PilV
MQLGGRDLAGRDLIALVAMIILVIALLGSGVGLEMHARQVADAKARAAAEAALAAQPKRAPPITTSVYVRSIPVRHAE